ncbi:hypothetical protein AtNW77_Chr1g0005211 [Arabidopsis thaliana]
MAEVEPAAPSQPKNRKLATVLSIMLCNKLCRLTLFDRFVVKCVLAFKMRWSMKR